MSSTTKTRPLFAGLPPGSQSDPSILVWRQERLEQEVQHLADRVGGVEQTQQQWQRRFEITRLALLIGLILAGALVRMPPEVKRLIGLLGS